MPVMGVRQADAMVLEAAPETYSAGDMTITANVSVVFAIDR